MQKAILQEVKTGWVFLPFFWAGMFLTFLCSFPLLAAEESIAAKKNLFAKAYDIASPSVVSIRGEKRVDTSELKQDGVRGGSHRQENVTGMGSGIILDERGYIITNYHVVKGLQHIQITTSDETVYRDVEFINYDPSTDLALLKVTPVKPLKPIVFDKNERVYICEDVLAIGNPFGYSNAAARGIVSGLNRPLTSSDTVSYESVIQTDTPINPGNSGGPLVNLDGEMIGMNAAVRDDAQNIAFAIPVDVVTRVAEKMIRHSIAPSLPEGLILEEVIQPTDEYPNGLTQTDLLRVLSVMPNSPAEMAGLKSGDVLLEVNERKVSRSLDFTRSLIGAASSEPLNIKVARGDKEMEVALSLGISGGDEIIRNEKEEMVAVYRPNTSSDQMPMEFQEAAAAPSYTQRVGGKSISSKEDVVYQNLGIRAEAVSKEDFQALYPNLSVVSMDHYKIIPSGGVLLTDVNSATVFKTAKSGVQTGDVIFGFVINNSPESRWEITSLENLYFIAKKWNEFHSLGSSAKIYLIRNGVPYYFDIPISSANTP